MQNVHGKQTRNAHFYKIPIGSCVECHNRKQLLNMCHIGAINVQFKTENYMK